MSRKEDTGQELLMIAATAVRGSTESLSSDLTIIRNWPRRTKQYLDPTAASSAEDA